MTASVKMLRVLPERGTTFRLQVYKRVGISLVEVDERVGKTVVSVGKKAQKGLTDAVTVAVKLS